MFFTCVARRRNSRPCASAGQPVARAADYQIGLRLPIDALSTSAALAVAAEVPERGDLVVLGERLRQLRRSPVTMLTTPAGTSLVSSTW